MKKIIALLLICMLALAFSLPQVASASGIVTLDAATGASSGTTSVIKLSLTHTASGTDRIVLLALGINKPTSSNVVCTYGGVPMVAHDWLNGSIYTLYQFFLVAPPTGPQVARCTWTGYGLARLNVVSFDGVNQVAPFYPGTSDYGRNTFSTNVITTPNDPSGMGVDFLLINGGGTVTLDPAQTLNVNANVGQTFHMLSSRKADPSGIFWMSESWPNQANYMSMLIILVPAQ